MCVYMYMFKYVYVCVYMCVCGYVYAYMHPCGICMGMIVYMCMSMMQVSTFINKLMDVVIIYLLCTLYTALCLKLINPYLRFRSL